MKKLGFAFAALSVIALAAPSVASAETTIIKRGGHPHFGGARAEYRDHGDIRAFRHPHTGKTVIIKKRREY
jgi:hypothetical protein